MELAPFEERATQAEKYLAILSARLDAIEKNQKESKNVTKNQSKSDILSPIHNDMKDLQRILIQDNENADQMVKELEELRKENEKLKYQVKHLIRNLKAEEIKNDQSISYHPVNTPETLDYKGYFRSNGKPISSWHDIPLWIDEIDGIANMIVEIPRQTQAKLEISKNNPLNPICQDVKNGKLRYVALKYPFNYGAFPQTWENPDFVHPDTKAKGDNDPLDVVDIGSELGKTGEIKKVKILGCYAMLDEGETDWKIIVIDIHDPLADKLNDIHDVETFLPGKLKDVFEFFRDYKVPDGKPQNKFAYDNQPKNKVFAIQITQEAHIEWQNLMKKGAKGISIQNTKLETNQITQDQAENIITQSKK